MGAIYSHPEISYLRSVNQVDLSQRGHGVRGLELAGFVLVQRALAPLWHRIHALGSDLADLSSAVASPQIRSAEGSYQQLGIVGDNPMNSPFPETQHGVFVVDRPGKYRFVGPAELINQLPGNQRMMRHDIVHR